MQEKVDRSKRPWIGSIIASLILGLFILIPLWGYHVIQSGFDNLTTWETGCAVESSITRFYQKHDRFPENWEEINTSYLENGYDKAGYGFPVEQLAEYVEVNFELFHKYNNGEWEPVELKEYTPEPREYTPWIIRGKNGHHYEFTENMHVFIENRHQEKMNEPEEHPVEKPTQTGEETE